MVEAGEGGMIGVDEAGRGPVLGPMIVAAVGVDDVGILPNEIDDSKVIPDNIRLEIASNLRSDERVSIGWETVSPALIDHPTTDLNSLTVQAMAKAIDQISKEGMSAILDAGDPNEHRFAMRVMQNLDTACPLSAEHGADGRYKIVGAASIVAKVERDRVIAELAERYGEIGSGYPSDPATRGFLTTYVRENGRLPPFARSSWKTCSDIVSTVNTKRLDEFTVPEKM